MPMLGVAATLDPVIHSSKIKTVESKISYSSDLITNEKVESRASTNLVDILRSTPSLNISQAGGPGGNYTISIRGAESRHTLVLIDGIKVNDPSDSTNSFNMPALTSLDIESIEVLKGPQGVLYGSDAIGGVINIITKKGERGGKLSLASGVVDEVSNSTSYYGKSNALYLNAFYNESNEISSLRSDSETDKSQNKGLTLNYTQVLGDVDIDWKVKFLDSFLEFDNALGDSDIPFSQTLNQLYSQRVTLKNLIHSISYVKNDRFSKFDGRSQYRYSGERVVNDIYYQHDQESLKAIFGLSHDYSTYSQSTIEDQKVNQYDAYASFDFQLSKLVLNQGVRVTIHEEFEKQITSSHGVIYDLGDRLKLKANYATGFKAPTPYQLYTVDAGTSGTTFGNIDLEPEKSRSLELSLFKQGNTSYSITLFDTHIDNFINYILIPSTTNSTYENADSLRTYGVDIGFSKKLKQFSFSFNGVLSKSHDSRRANALKKPKQKVNFTVDHKINDKQSIHLDAFWVASQYDFGDKHIKAYDIFNISYLYSQETYNLKAGVQNLFDRDYEEVSGYNTLGINYFLKLTVNY